MVLKDMGLYEVNMGIQSGSERIRKEIYNRHESNEQIINSIKIFNRYKIRVTCDLILGNPYETEIDKKENLKLLMKVPKPIILLTYTLLFFPNKFTERALADGLIGEKNLEENNDRRIDKWHKKFDSGLSNTDLFWNTLYYLTSKGYSAKFINKIYNSKSLRTNPKVLVLLVKWIEKKNVFLSSIPKIIDYIKRKQFKLLLTKLKTRLRR
jgi:radical SAM superfamily enzyme YgiQ (UPF0313 family)